MAAGATFIPIATYTVPSSLGSYTFSSIPQSYTDLRLVMTGTASGNSYATIQINGASSGYSYTFMYGNGSAAFSARGTTAGMSALSGPVPWNDTEPATSIWDFMSYASTTTYKSILQRDNRAANYMAAAVHMYNSNTAISSMTLITNNFNTGCTFTLYGITAA